MGGITIPGKKSSSAHIVGISLKPRHSEGFFDLTPQSALAWGKREDFGAKFAKIKKIYNLPFW
jgi:hypothetical protein